MREEEQEHGTLLGGEDQLFIIFVEAHRGGRVGEGTAADIFRIRGDAGFISPDERFHLGSENQRAERLCDVVIRAEREPVERVVVLAAAADDHDRGVEPPCTNIPDDLKALHVTEGDIHEDHIVGIFVDLFDRLVPA